LLVCFFFAPEAAPLVAAAPVCGFCAGLPAADEPAGDRFEAVARLRLCVAADAIEGSAT